MSHSRRIIGRLFRGSKRSHSERVGIEAEIRARQGGGLTHVEDGVPVEEREPPLHDFGLPVSQALNRLLGLAETADKQHPLAPLRNRLSAKLQRALAMDELVPTLDDLRELLGDAMLHNVHNYEAFLLQLDERLDDSLQQLQASRGYVGQRAQMDEQLDANLQGSMQRMRGRLESDTELHELRTTLRGDIDEMNRELEQARSHARELEVEFVSHLDLLITRIGDLETQTRQAEKDLAHHRELAVTDSLTGLPNREGLRERISAELERFHRYGRPLAVVMCDVDHFKTVNDSYGHLGGDETLRQIAHSIGQRMRETDFVARYGGEEFVVLMPETEPDEARQVMEQLRQSIAQEHVAYMGQSIRVTASFGIACFEPGDSIERTLHRADAALYLAKSRGRNRVLIYGDAPGQPDD